jgi:hypothetical protein
MHLAKKFAAMATVVTALALAGQASAFTPPTTLVPYLPANNLVTITKIKSTVPGVDQYLCSTGTVLSVAAGTPVASVQKLAASNLAFAKFKAATLTPAQQVNPVQLQLATIWFMNNIGRPLYGL